MKERTVSLTLALALVAFGLLMRSQLAGIPEEGVLFPLCVIWLLMGCSVLMAAQSCLRHEAVLTFFGQVPPLRWCLVTSIFLLQSLGSLYLSFTLSMGAGMFATLCVLMPKRQGKSPLHTLAGNALFTLLFLLFFRLFFHRPYAYLFS